MSFFMLFSFLLLRFCIVSCDDVETILYSYNYTATNCTTGLMVNMPLHLEGFIGFPGNESDKDTVISIEWRGLKKTEFIEFFNILKLTLCSDLETFFCTPLQDKLGYSVYLHTLAYEMLSQSEWRLKVTYKGTPYFSKVIVIPKIYSRENITFIVNDQQWFPGNTSLTVTSEKLNICCRGGPLPCEAFVSVNSKPKVYDSPCVRETIDAPVGVEYVDVTFGFRVCTEDSSSQNYSITVRIEPQSVIENNSWENTLIVVFIGLATVVLAFFGFLIFYYKDYKCKDKKEENPEPSQPQQRQDGENPAQVIQVEESCGTVRKSNNQRRGKNSKPKEKTPSEVTTSENKPLLQDQKEDYCTFENNAEQERVENIIKTKKHNSCPVDAIITSGKPMPIQRSVSASETIVRHRKDQMQNPQRMQTK